MAQAGHSSAKGKEVSEFVNVRDVLYFMAKSFDAAQKAADQRVLELARVFTESVKGGYSVEENRLVRAPAPAGKESGTQLVQFTELVSFQRYGISEMVVDFGIAEESGPSVKPMEEIRFRIVPRGLKANRALPACIRITGKENVMAEFQINGETKETLVLKKNG